MLSRTGHGGLEAFVWSRYRKDNKVESRLVVRVFWRGGRGTGDNTALCAQDEAARCSHADRRSGLAGSDADFCPMGRGRRAADITLPRRALQAER